jgi:hypothetical protein
MVVLVIDYVLMLFCFPGFVARLQVFQPPKKHQLYDDADFFEVSGNCYQTFEKNYIPLGF